MNIRGLIKEELDKVNNFSISEYNILKDRVDTMLKGLPPKTVNYRDVNKSIKYNNYYICTKGDFKNIGLNIRSDMDKFWDKLKRNNKYSISPKSNSEYILDDKGNVYRYSDHWGLISGCEWTINGYSGEKLTIGVIKLKDFKLMDICDNKYYITNPEYYEIAIPLVNEFLNIINGYLNNKYLQISSVLLSKLKILKNDLTNIKKSKTR